MEEIWKDIKDYEGFYQVSNLGNVKSLERKVNSKIKNNNFVIKKEKILSKTKLNNGYEQVHLSKEGITRKKQVHRLVAEAFIPNPDNLPQINHKDEDKTNNSVFMNDDGSIDSDKSNLEWCTAKHNVNHGTGHYRSCITRRKCCTKEVFQFALDGSFIQSFYSCSEASRKTGINLSCISSAAKHVSYTAGSYLWSYTPDYDFALEKKYISKYY